MLISIEIAKFEEFSKRKFSANHIIYSNFLHLNKLLAKPPILSQFTYYFPIRLQTIEDSFFKIQACHVPGFK